MCAELSLYNYNSRRVSVIRGRVLTPSGQGLRGVRVSNGAAQKEGFTLTRSDGVFDILVTAGKTINLKFGRSPFPYQTKNIFVPSNQVRREAERRLTLSNFLFRS